jgi:hypothetical protein
MELLNALRMGACVVGLGIWLGLLPAGSSAQSAEEITIEFEEQNDSGARGIATLTSDGDQTIVALDISGLTGHHPDHIHRGTCDDPEPDPLFPLSDVVLERTDETGHSETLVDVTLDELLDEPHLILIHKSMEEINVYVACADIVASGTGGEASGMPNTGAGSAMAGDPIDRAAWLAGLAAAASLAFAAVRRWAPSRS